MADDESDSFIQYLPIIAFLWLILTLIVTYTIAVLYKHIYPLFPFVSDCGTLPPESCWFGQMMNIEALLMGLIFYFQYEQIKLKITPQTSVHIKNLNVVALVFGQIAAVGGSMVACFQETNLYIMHIIGANMAFAIGAIYFIIETVLCFHLNGGDLVGYRLNCFRAFLCCTHVLTYFTTFIFARLSQKRRMTRLEALQFNPSHAHYNWRLASTFSEWILTICMSLFVLTFHYDFKYFKSHTEYFDTRRRRNQQ